MAAVQDKRGGIPDNLKSLAVNYSAPYYSNNVNVNHKENIGPGAGGQNYNLGPGAGGVNSGEGAGAINAKNIKGGVMNRDSDKPRALPKGSFDGNGPIGNANGLARTTQESQDSSLPDLTSDFFRAWNQNPKYSPERDAEPIKYGNGVTDRIGSIFDPQEDDDHDSHLGNNRNGFVMKTYANTNRFGQRAPTGVQFGSQSRSSVVPPFPPEYSGLPSFYSQPQNSALSLRSEHPRRSVVFGSPRPNMVSTKMSTGPMTGGFGSSQGYTVTRGFSF